MSMICFLNTGLNDLGQIEIGLVMANVDDMIWVTISVDNQYSFRLNDLCQFEIDLVMANVS